ncbi:MAG: hypothetical protein K2X81_19915 [Candidatus Obscuribacterales bacterium]|nr:hypothetical protein [Candidatus Obscuribacterales bacterium]
MLPVKIEKNQTAPDSVKLIVEAERNGEFVYFHELLDFMPVISFDRITEFRLDLWESKLSTKEIALIAASDWAQRITDLCLSSENLTNGSLKEVAKLKSLQWLSLISCTHKITHLGLRHLANLPLLKYIYFRPGLLNRKTVEALSAVPNLRELAINCSAKPISDQTLRVLSCLKTAQPLDLSLEDGEFVGTAEGLLQLAAIKNLQNLQINASGIPHEITHQTARRLFATMPELKAIYFRQLNETFKRDQI